MGEQTTEPQLVPCPVCSERNHVQLRPYRAHSKVLTGLHLVSCENCGLVFADPMPTPEQWQAYNLAYADNAHGGLNLNPQALLFFDGIAQLRLDFVLAYAQAGSFFPQAALEIGPGHGFFFQHFRRRFSRCRYVVVESDASCQQRLRGMGAEVHAAYESLDGETGEFDLLILSHVLEHTADPCDFLSRPIAAVKPGGVVFIEVPCRDHEFKEEDESHLLFFDKSAMLTLFERLKLEDVHISYHGREIDRLKRRSPLQDRFSAKWEAVKRKLGVDFSRRPATIDDPAVWAAVRLHEAHLTKERPSWWLRAMARKGEAGA